MKLLNRTRDDDLTQVHEAVPADADELGGQALPEVPDFACPSCGAGMDAGQDWCLECGTAAPGRLGTRPGWRAALTVTTVTAVLVLGAVMAAYAAITTDATRDTRDGQPNGAPIQAQVPPPPAPPSATTLPPATGEEPSIPAPKAASSASETEPVPSGDGGADRVPDGGGGAAVTAPSGGGGGGAPAPSGRGGGSVSGRGGSAAPAPRPVGPIALAAGSGSIYNPSARSGARFSDPTGAYDGTQRNAFTISAPADGDPFGAGIAFRFGDPRELRSLEIATETEGFTVEVYGSASGTRPPDILDRRWANLGRRTGVKDGAKISLDSDEVNRVRHVLVWIAGVPPGTGAKDGSTRRTVALNELRFRGR